MKKIILLMFLLILSVCAFCDNVPRPLVDNSDFFGLTVNEYNQLGLSRIQKTKAGKIIKRVNRSGLTQGAKFLTLRDDFYRILNGRQKGNYDDMIYYRCEDYYWGLASQLDFSEIQRNELKRLIDNTNFFADAFENGFLRILTFYQRDRYYFIQYGEYRKMW